jgi:hypothetical protein
MNFECRSFRKGFASAFFFLLFFGLSFLQSHSQVLDSIQFCFKKKPHLTGGISTKNTFINGFTSPVYTARMGLDFDNRIKMGIGISWLKLSKYHIGRDNTPFYIDKYIADQSGLQIVHPELQFRYVNLFVEYVYYKTGKWQFSIPILIGVGDSRYKYNFNDRPIVESKHLIFLYEPVVSGQYKINKWFGAGLDVGYRIMIIGNRHIGSKFNSPIYDLGVIIFWGELYRTVLKVKRSLQCQMF